MDLENLKEWRQVRMRALADKYGSNATLGRNLGYRDGAYVGQMISGHRPITEKTIELAETLPGCAGWFDTPGPEALMALSERRVRYIKQRRELMVEKGITDPLQISPDNPNGDRELKSLQTKIEELGRMLGAIQGSSTGQISVDDVPRSDATGAAVPVAPSLKLSPEASTGRTEINLENNPDYPAIRRVKFKLSAGASGFGVDYVGDDAAPIVFQRAWYEGRGLTPGKLFAIKVANGSMEPGLHDGDTVVVNTGSADPKDGVVYAVNYEGELVVKRLVRDEGSLWLSSDNPDQRRYPRKRMTEDCFVLGEIVHKQSERI
jgi:phage repressor protein C with HTH and peptisase S24 domain